jgi:hypothetical protein
VSKSKSFQRKLFIDKLVDLQKFSEFSKGTIMFVVVVMNLIVVVINALQTYHSKNIEKWLNRIVSQKFDQQLIAELDKKCWRFSLLVGLIFAFISIVQMIGALKFSVVGLLVNFIFLYPNFVLLAFVMFVKFFSIFTSILLEKFKSDLETSNSSNDFYVLIQKYRLILRNVREFNECFNYQITIFVCYCSLVMVFNVSDISTRYQFQLTFSIVSRPSMDFNIWSKLTISIPKYQDLWRIFFLATFFGHFPQSERTSRNWKMKSFKESMDQPM